MSKLFVDDIVEKTSGHGVQIADLVPNAGSVAQVQRYQDASAGSGTSTSTSYVDDGVSISITPKFPNSILFVTCTSGSSISGGYGYFRILESVSSTVVQEIPFGNFSSSPQWLLGFTLGGWYTPSNTTQRTFKLQGKTTAGTRYVNYYVRPTISVMEIAQ